MRVAQRPARALLAVSFVVLVLGVAITATNVVPASRADAPSGGSPTANQLKPAACAALNLATVRLVSGTFTGTAAAELIIGSPAWTRSAAGTGATASSAAAGTTRSRDNGTDVCIGGAGTDTFHATCETQLQ